MSDVYAWIDPFEEIEKRSREARNQGFKSGVSSVMSEIDHCGAKLLRESMKSLRAYPEDIQRQALDRADFRMERAFNPNQMANEVIAEIALVQPFRVAIKTPIGVW